VSIISLLPSAADLLSVFFGLARCTEVAQVDGIGAAT
jgi:hypothetical protein